MLAPNKADTLRIPRVYLDQPLQTDAEFALGKTATHYLSSVLRLRTGDALIVFNGTGGEFTATLQAISSKNTRILTGNFHIGTPPSPIPIALAIGLSRGERMDWVIQKAVELGVTEIHPLFTERCEVKLKGERALKKRQHWQQIAISACEQSQRNDLPRISPPQTLQQFAGSLSTDLALILDPKAGQSLARLVSKQTPAPESCLLLSGPEGGFSDEEVALTQQYGTTPVRLGPRVLRTETAPLAALSIIQSLLGDMA